MGTIPLVWAGGNEAHFLFGFCKIGGLGLCPADFRA
jgi:hypothetical protein